MLMSHYRGWMLMLHGTAFIADTQQHAASHPTGPSPATCAWSARWVPGSGWRS